MLRAVGIVTLCRVAHLPCGLLLDFIFTTRAHRNHLILLVRDLYRFHRIIIFGRDHASMTILELDRFSIRLPSNLRPSLGL